MGENAELKTLIKKRGNFKARQTNFKKYFDPLMQQININDIKNVDRGIILELEARLANHDVMWEEFKEVQEAIEMLVDEQDLDKQLQEREEFEACYYKLCAGCKKVIDAYNELLGNTADEAGSIHSSGNSVAPSQGQNQFNPLRSVNLPPINLKKFSGEFKNWLEFRDLFESLINSNPCLSAIQKFYYLIASLEGSAAQIISSIELSGDNYAIAWNALCSRYDNSGLLVHNHVKSLFNIPSLVNESSVEVRKMVDNIAKNIQCLKTLKQPTDSWDTLLIYMFCGKLDKKTAREWEERKMQKVNNEVSSNTVQCDELPTLKEFLDFLKQKADLLETLELSKQKTDLKQNEQKPVKNYSRSFNVSNHTCVLCKGSHYLQNCAEFMKLTVNERVEKVKQFRLCFNCLKSGHSIRDCKAGACRNCKLKHNTLIHYDRKQVDKGREEVAEAQQAQQTSTEVLTTINMADKVYGESQVLLQTALVQIVDSSGVPQTCRALLDGASQSNLITYDCCNRLGLRKQDLSAAVTGISQTVISLKHRCKAEVRSCHNPFSVNLSCLVIPKISSTYPSHQVNVASWNIPQHLRLADPGFNKPGEIDILIGGGVYLNTLCIGQMKLGPQLPILQKTQFGWVLGGEVGQNDSLSQYRCNFISNMDIQEQLAQFWEIENAVSTGKVFSEEEKQCEEMFQRTTTKVEGRFVVQMPFRKGPECLGDSRQNAVKRFRSLEGKLTRNPMLKERYVQFMEEYISLGHMVKVEVRERETEPCFYFPHHGVLNERSPTTKLRAVFDGSASSDSGVSLNDLQFTGPILQDDLFSIILRFRQHAVVVCADIIKMYRQILIDPSQRRLQRVLWRTDSSKELDTYELQTVTYGTTSAPFLAVRCLRQLAEEGKVLYPGASRVVSNDFYMDDMITGTHSIEAAKLLCDEVRQLLGLGCFELQKWASNKRELLEYVKSETSPASVLVFGETEKTRTLGLYWACERDSLMYGIVVETHDRQVTKRTVLSGISQIFDPLGLLAPCVIVAKVLMQQLWLCKLSWDESLPADLDTKWRRFRSELGEINNLQIPRHVVCEQPVKIQVHGFADASLQAYGACVYLRSEDVTGQIQVRLLCAKTKVAPLKTITIPRLELCAALMLANLVQKVRSAMTIEFSRCYLWSDSTVCLSWIQTPPNLLQTFVGNRVAQIQSLSGTDQWYHVSTGDNPADLLSRGVSPRLLQNSDLWWCGPAWLRSVEEQWPKSKVARSEIVPELKKQVITMKVEKYEVLALTRFSKFSRLVRVVAWCHRFVNNCRLKKRNSSPLTVKDLKDSLKSVLRLYQGEMFPVEVEVLKKGNSLPAKNRLLSLSPFLDSDGVLRVGGRIQLGAFSYEKKHPALVCSSHPFTRLLFESEHLRLLHAGPQQLLSIVRDNYWPLGGRSLARRVVHNCVRCFRVKPKQSNPMMGLLPEGRVKPAPPFSNCGVDYAGPLFIRNKLGRGALKSKCYICIFICMTTRAVHLELVTDLTKEAFLAALRRFVSRRGKPVNIYSDNGTNFVGARNELKALGSFVKLGSGELSEIAAQQGVNWHFIPALSPHFGGIWEAGVKSCKFHLRRVLANACLTFEGLYTVLTEIEAILNSRPMTPLSSDPDDLTALTPSHFLIGQAMATLPSADLQHIKESRLSYYQRLQLLQQHFWSRWSREYIPELQRRVKWQRHQRDLQLGDLVVLKEESSPPLQWSLGRIIDVHPGPDGIARVASVKTNKGVIKRSFSKICVLPVDTVCGNGEVKCTEVSKL